MLSSHGVKREGQPVGAQPASKVFVQAHSQPESQTRIIQHHQDQTFFQSSKLSLESPVESQNQELHSSQLQSQLETTSSIQPQFLPRFMKNLQKPKAKLYPSTACRARTALLSSVVSRKVQLNPKLTFNWSCRLKPNQSLWTIKPSSCLSKHKPKQWLWTFTGYLCRPKPIQWLGPSEPHVVSANSSQTGGFRPLDSLQVISEDSGETRGFGPTDLQIISIDSSQSSGIEQSNPLQSLFQLHPAQACCLHRLPWLNWGCQSSSTLIHHQLATTNLFGDPTPKTKDSGQKSQFPKAPWAITNSACYLTCILPKNFAYTSISDSTKDANRTEPWFTTERQPQTSVMTQHQDKGFYIQKSQLSTAIRGSRCSPCPSTEWGVCQSSGFGQEQTG